MSKNIATLKSGSRVNQSHWKWYHSIDWVWFPISVLYSNFFPFPWDIRLQNWSYRSVKVIENVTIWQSTSDFLLTIHSNNGPISYRFRDIRRFQSKIAKFFHPCILHPCWRGYPWSWVSALAVRKLEWWGYRAKKRSLTISSAVSIPSTNVTDGRTNGHQATANTALTHSVAR